MEVFRAFLKNPPSFITDVARKNNPALNDVKPDVLHSASSYIHDVVNGKIYGKDAYGLTPKALAEHVSSIVEAHGLDVKHFDATVEEVHKRNRELFEVVNENDEVRIRSNGIWGKRLGWLTPKQIKLHLLKQIINGLAPQLPKIIGGDARDRFDSPSQPASELTQRVFKRMEHALTYEQKEGLLPTSRDTNMANLLRAMERSLIFVSEEDNYYRAWMAYFYLVIWEEVSRFYIEFDAKTFMEDLSKRTHAKVNFKRDDGVDIPLEEMFKVQTAKRQLFSWYMGKHLPYLQET
jgi:hypothetical protein